MSRSMVFRVAFIALDIFKEISTYLIVQKLFILTSLPVKLVRFIVAWLSIKRTLLIRPGFTQEKMRPDMSGLDPKDLQRYAIRAEIDEAVDGKVPRGGLVTVKSNRKESKGKRDKSNGDGSRSDKKKKPRR